MATDISVVQITEDYSLTISKDGVNGTRSYVTASLLSDKDSVFLPYIGDSWSDDYPLVVVDNIDATAIEENPYCGYKYIVTYGPRTEDSKDDDGDFLPITYEVSSVNETYSETGVIKKSGFGADGIYSGKHLDNDDEDVIAAKKHWVWPDGGIAIGLQAVKRQVNVGLKITMVAKIDSADFFHQKSILKVGKVNSSKFLGSPKGLVLYLGAEMSELNTDNAKRKWEIVTHYLVNVKDGIFEAENGHNKVFRPGAGVNNWDTPLLDGEKIYKATSFASLLPTDKIPDLFPPIPEKL